MDEIKSWLESDGDYNDGVALMMRHSKNRNIINYLSRKQDRPKLRYELSKLAGVAARVVVPVVLAPDETHEPEVKGFERTQIDELPEEIKPYAEAAMEAYHKARVCHTHLKDESETDQQRAGLRKELLKHLEANHKNWAVVDAFRADGTLPQEPTEAKVVSQSLLNAASNLSKAIGALEKQPPAEESKKLKAKINALLAELKEGGREPNAKVQARLTELGLM